MDRTIGLCYNILSSFSASSLYLFRIVAPVTPATSLCVLRLPQSTDAMFQATDTTPVGLVPLVSSLAIRFM